MVLPAADALGTRRNCCTVWPAATVSGMPQAVPCARQLMPLVMSCVLTWFCPTWSFGETHGSVSRCSCCVQPCCKRCDTCRACIVLWCCRPPLLVPTSPSLAAAALAAAAAPSKPHPGAHPHLQLPPRSSSVPPRGGSSWRVRVGTPLTRIRQLWWSGGGCMHMVCLGSLVAYS